MHNFINDVVRIERPVYHRGGLSVWRVGTDELADAKNQAIAALAQRAANATATPAA